MGGEEAPDCPLLSASLPLKMTSQNNGIKQQDMQISPETERKLLCRMGKLLLVAPRLREFREKFDEMAYRFYEVAPFKEGLFRTLETLIVVARAVDE